MENTNISLLKRVKEIGHKNSIERYGSKRKFSLYVQTLIEEDDKKLKKRKK